MHHRLVACMQHAPYDVLTAAPYTFAAPQSCIKHLLHRGRKADGMHLHSSTKENAPNVAA
jgi:hypothetical protein